LKPNEPVEIVPIALLAVVADFEQESCSDSASSFDRAASPSDFP